MASRVRTFTSHCNRSPWLWMWLWLCLTLWTQIGFATTQKLTFYVDENAPNGTIVGTIPNNGGTFIAIGTIPSAIDNVVLQTGVVKTTRYLDREIKDKITFNVLSSSSKYYTVEIIVNDLNDNSPKFKKSVYFERIDEGSSMGRDVLVEAEDKDKGINSTQKYSIISGNTGHTFKLTSITRSDGSVYGKVLLNGTLDREKLARYVLNISAQDGGTPPRVGYAILNITVADTNDNSPVFSSRNYFGKITENAKEGTVIITVSATDVDIGSNAEIRYEIDRGSHSDPQRIFNVDFRTGVVTNNLKVDYEKKQEYRIVVRAKNTGVSGSIMTDTAWLTIKVLDKNDNSPVVTVTYVLGGSYQVLEGAANGITVARIVVSDPDSGSNGQVDVSLQNTEGYFKMERIPGDGYAVKVAKSIDRETKSVFIPKIVAKDKGNPPRTTEESFRINIGDINDNSPKFDVPVYKASVAEDADKDKLVLTVHATDRDAGTNAELQYAIVSSVSNTAYRNWFTIIPSTGKIKTAAVLDRENVSQLVLSVTVTDKGTPPQTDNCTVIIEIRDANDNDPYFNQSLYQASVVENSQNGSHVMQVFAQDKDVGLNSVITYSTDKPSDDFPFSITNDSGIISITGLVDHERRTFYTFHVVATDGGGRNSTAQVNITVVDQNDNSPVFSPEYYNISLPENVKVGSVLVNVSASDKDSGVFARLHYTIKDGNSDSLFLINHATGAVRLAQPLDRETTDFHSLTIQTIDGGHRMSTNFASVNLRVLDVNDEAPVFSKLKYNFSIVENSKVGTLLGTVLATSKDIGSNAEIFYTFKRGNIGGIFAVNGTGTMYLRAPIDRERTPNLVLEVEAKDGGKPPLFGYTNVTVTVVDLNDNSPDFNSSEISVYIPEDTKVGEPFYTLTARDTDAGDYGRVKYTLLKNPNSTFELDSNTGNMSLKKPVSYEGVTLFSARVLAQDGGVPSRNATVTLRLEVVDVNDNSPVFVNSSYSVHVSEATDANGDIIKVSATDKDSGTNSVITYSLQSQPNSVSSKFGIKSDGTVYLRTKLDRETKDVYYLIIIAADHGVPVRTAKADLTVYVTDVNDNSPKFNRTQEYTFNILEEQRIGTFVGRLHATDIDKGSNAQLMYKFDSAVPQFDLNRISGEIRTAVKLDREAKADYDLMAVVSDSSTNPRQDKVRVIVLVGDQNDNDPVFDPDAKYTTSIREDSAVGRSVLSISASDPDDGMNAQLTYSIITGDEHNLFKINSQSGVITTAAALDREVKELYVLSIEARDSGNPQRSSSRMVFINILDINDNSPQFENNTKAVYLSEKLAAGSYVTTVKADDADKHLNGQVWYKITKGNIGDTFIINKTSGDIYTTKALDYERTNLYELHIKATDKAQTNPKSDVMYVMVYIWDKNDNRPTFKTNPMFQHLSEGVPINTTLAVRMEAQDADSKGPNSNIWYQIDSQSPGLPHFRIDQKTGIVSTIAVIDREAIDEFTLIIRATDQAYAEQERLSSTATLVVIITDINDNKPRFTSRSFTYVMEDEPVQYPVMTITAVDDDEGSNGVVRYGMANRNDELHFHLDKYTGQLKLIGQLDHEKQPKYILNITAQDSGTPALMSYQLLTVSVVDVNDNPPKFNKSLYFGKVSENQAPGSFVVRVEATDRDSGTNADLSYSIPQGVDKDKFVINAKSGIITTNTTLDHEKKDGYELTVYVHDGAFPFRADTTTVRIQVLDMNDNPPNFMPAFLVLQVAENQAPAPFHTMVVQDADIGDNSRVEFKIISGNSRGYFGIDTYSGVLSTTVSLDRENTSCYELVIQAKNIITPFYAATANVTVLVEDQNDNKPKFIPDSYTVSVKELTPLNTNILNVSAVDRDAGTNGMITYSLNSQAVGRFRVDAQTGYIFTMQQFDYKKQSQYNFVCIATDQGTMPAKFFAQVSVQIQDQNNHAPVFNQFPYQANISSGKGSDYHVVQVIATDGDTGTNALISYSLNSSSSHFNLDSNSGNIKTSSSVPDGRYILCILATDQGVPHLTGRGIVEILVGQVVDAPPTFVNASPSAVSIPENSPKGSEVARVLATYSGGSTAYSIIDGNDGNTFSIGAVTGIVAISDMSKLDYESTKKFELNIVATSTSKSGTYLNAYLKLVISLLDENDNAPMFHPANLNIQLLEDNGVDSGNFHPRLVTDINATDVDSDGNAKIVYSIESGNSGGRFKIDTSSGQIKTTTLLDREKESFYNLIVKATNVGNPQQFASSSVRITITDRNDNKPMFVGHTTSQVPEDTKVGTVIAQLNATDNDQNSRLIYTFKSGVNEEGHFGIGKFSGAIFLVKRLDYETQKSYSLDLIVNDTLHAAEVNFNVSVLDVNDQSPVFEEKSYYKTIKEDVGAGVSILRVSAKDKDSGRNGKVTYAFQIPFVPVNYFVIDRTSGVISTSKAITTSKDAYIQLLVSASDGGEPSNNAVVSVNIAIQKSIVFSKDRYQGTVPENAAVGTEVVAVSAMGRSLLGKVSYSIHGGSSVPFRIERRSGMIKVSGKLDFEKKRNYTLYVKAAGSQTVTTTRVDIYVQDVNDNAPEFSKSHYVKTVPENVRVGTTLFKFNATDKDSGTNGEIRFHIQSGDVKKSFHIDNWTGVLTTAKSLDHDTLKSHKLAVEARDEGDPAKATVVSVTVDVSDLNDNKPVFHVPNQLTVLEGSEPGQAVGRITASDRDSGTNGKVTYSIIGGDGQEMFLIDAHTGDLITNTSFDYEFRSSYTLTIKAVDGGEESLWSNVTVTVNIGSKDEFDPQFTKREYEFEVSGNAKVGDKIGRVHAIDADEGPDGVIYYSLDEPSTDALDVNKTSGWIYVNRTFDKAQGLRSKRSVGSDTRTKHRVRRNADLVSNVQLRVRADSGKTDSRNDVSYVKVAIVFPATSGTSASQFSQQAVALIVGLACLAGILVLVIVVLALIFKKKKKKRNRRDPPLRFDCSFDEITVLPPPPNGTANYAHVGQSEEDLPRPRVIPDEFTPLNRRGEESSSPSNRSANSSETPGSAGSASSGRGSEGDGDFGESQTVLIGDKASVYSENMNGKASIVPDSGIQQDDDQISQLTVSDGSEIFTAHVDGFASESKSDKTDKTDRILRGLESQESLHVFGEEGGGEADGGMDVGNLLYAKLAEVDADEDESITDGTQPYIDEGNNQPSYGGSLSSIVGSQEELTGSYNWDYLLNWGPQFQPLADVFLEIGRMKDEVHFHPKMEHGSLPSSHAAQALAAGTRTTDMLSSVSSLPRSPISHPSTSYSSPALSPNFTPAITPLVTRSPSISPLDTPSPLLSPQSATPAAHSRPASTHLVLQRDLHDGSNSDLTHSPSISDNESNLEIDV